MENRIDVLRETIDEVLMAISDPYNRRCACLHLYGVAQACALIAMKRGVDVELATMAGMLHDLHIYKSGDGRDHAREGALLAREVLCALGLTDARETDLICAAIHNHSTKDGCFAQLDEALIDADVIQHVLYDATKPVMPHEAERFARLAEEFGLLFDKSAQG